MSDIIKEIMRSKAFARGFNEARYGIPMDYKVYFDERKERVRYERGRLFGCIYKDNVKVNGRLSNDAYWEFSDAIRANYIR